MYVRKFEADTLEEALKQIKKEMGPDAIILKTVNNKGIKGAFKKKKIEITAAISESNYVKKARVDVVLDDGQKEQFYSDNAQSIKQTIDRHADNTTPSNPYSSANQYSKLALNRPVKTVVTEQVSKGLDAFLGEEEPRTERPSKKENSLMDSFERGLEADFDEDLLDRPAPRKNWLSDDDGPVESLDSMLSEAESRRPVVEKKKPAPPREAPRPMAQSSAAPQPQAKPVAPQAAPPAPTPVSAPEPAPAVAEMSEEVAIKMEILERQVFELKKSVDALERKEPTGVYQLRTTLRSLDIGDKYINQLIRKTSFDLSEADRQNSDVVFEYALREMLEKIHTDMPLFSKVNEDETPVITVLLSEISSGQTSMMLKLGALKSDAVLIQKSKKNQGENIQFFEKMFGLKIVQCESTAEVVGECRKAHQERKSVIIDFETSKVDVDDTKKFVEGLRRSFSHVEVLISLSAIHSELYNKKVVSLYKGLADGLVISHLDLCMNFGALFNLSETFPDQPYKFFGTGKVIPDDLEAATAERILAGIFHL